MEETPQSAEAPNSSAPPSPPVRGDKFTTRIVGIRFRDYGKVYDFDAGDFKIARGDKVVVDHEEKGYMLGYVSKPVITIEPDILKLRLPPVLRPANHNDIKSKEKNDQYEQEALLAVKRMIKDRNLPMHIIAIEIPLNAKKANVYFSAPERVDFRELVKELVNFFRMRVELKQQASRDETKYVGGLGPCGQETCCSRFIKRFQNVNIKMAKEQNLSLTPTKVSGNCGRLKCCLAYEAQVYSENKKGMPKVGNCVKCSTGCGVVKKQEILKRTVTVLFDDGQIRDVPVEEILEVTTMDRSLKNEQNSREEEIPEDVDLAPLEEEADGTAE